MQLDLWEILMSILIRLVKFKVNLHIYDQYLLKLCWLMTQKKIKNSWKLNIKQKS